MGHTVRMSADQGASQDAGQSADEGRHETREERLDRLWSDLLQELRVMQTGAQLIAGFLLTLPFQQRFGMLETAQKGLYLGLVVLALLTTGLIMTAVAVHQRLSGRHIKERVVGATRRLVVVILATLSLLIVGISILLFDLVVNRWVAIAVGVVFAGILALLLLGVPRLLLRHTVE